MISFQGKSIEIDNEEVSFDSMKLEEANYFIVEKNLTFYISLENKKNKNVETFDINFINKN
jgi:hypothetical protein